MTHHPSPLSLLSPAMRSVLERMARAQRVPLHALSAPQARAAYAANHDVLDLPLQPLARVEDHLICSRDGARLPLRLLAPSTQPLPTLLYLHGGGFVLGGIATHEGLCRRLAVQAHCAVALVDYRLAPEHRFPTAFNDSLDALNALWTGADSYQIDSNRLAVGGDSAGGTLAAALALAAREAQLPLALQLLFYPGTCAHADTASHKTFGQDFLLEAAHIAYFFDHYIPDRAQRSDWRFAPLCADEVAGVAPAWLGLAECDPLFDEGIAYADRLRAAGVAVDLEVYHGVVHEFLKMGRVIVQAQQAISDAARALRAAFAAV